MRVNAAAGRSPETRPTAEAFARLRRRLDLQRRAAAEKDVKIAALLHQLRERNAIIARLQAEESTFRRHPLHAIPGQNPLGVILGQGEAATRGPRPQEARPQEGRP